MINVKSHLVLFSSRPLGVWMRVQRTLNQVIDSFWRGCDDGDWRVVCSSMGENRWMAAGGTGGERHRYVLQIIADLFFFNYSTNHMTLNLFCALQIDQDQEEIAYTTNLLQLLKHVLARTLCCTKGE